MSIKTRTTVPANDSASARGDITIQQPRGYSYSSCWRLLAPVAGELSYIKISRFPWSARYRYRFCVIAFICGTSSNKNVRLLGPRVRFSFFLANCTHAQQPLHKYYKGGLLLVLRWASDVIECVVRTPGNHEHFSKRPNVSAASELDHHIFYARLPRRRYCRALHV